jgi:hypothetical protein
VVSARSESTQLSLSCRQDRLEVELLDGSDVGLHNESGAQVRTRSITLACREGLAGFEIPAYSLAVVRP